MANPIEAAREAYLRAVAAAWQAYEEDMEKAQRDVMLFTPENYQEAIEAAHKKQVEAFLVAYKDYEEAIK